MNPPATVKELTELGRVRLSEHFFMWELLYSEVAHFPGCRTCPTTPTSRSPPGDGYAENFSNRCIGPSVMSLCEAPTARLK